jgi:hypothetical protein
MFTTFSFIAMSPSKSAVACQAPMEVIPLVLEPHSNFYVDPVIVLVSYKFIWIHENIHELHFT